MSSKHGIPGLLNGTYEENGPPLADADVMLTSIPINLLEEYHTAATQDSESLGSLSHSVSPPLPLLLQGVFNLFSSLLHFQVICLGLTDSSVVSQSP